MARFQFNLRQFLMPSGVHASLAQRMLRDLQRDLPQEDAAESPRGPGWFDSSWDLSHGLEVHEGQPGDARCDAWLAARALAERRAAAQRSARSARRAAPAPATAAPADDFSRFDIEGLELA